jgi:hypothetical protein
MTSPLTFLGIHKLTQCTSTLRVRYKDLPKLNDRVELRIPYQEGIELEKTLFRTQKERVVLALVGGAALSNSYVILMHSLLPVPPKAYLKSLSSTAWKAEFNAEAIDAAAKARLGLLILHSHGSQFPPKLSPTDIANGSQLCDAFRTAIPKSPHGTAVFGRGGSVSGLVWKPCQTLSTAMYNVRWINDPVRIIPPLETKYRSEEKYSSQRLLIGEGGQRMLKASKVGVIGLCGGGSHVVEQLALLGVGTIIGVDYDLIEERNRDRLIGAKPNDVKQKVSKTSIMSRLVKETNPEVTFVAVQERFPSVNSIKMLKECDVLIGCVDTLNARKEIQKFAWRYLIPYVDIGLTLVPCKDGSRADRISGQVYDLIPGAACLWCAQFLTEERLSKESGGRGSAYVVGGQEAQVVSFNGVLASQAVTEALHLITGFAQRHSISNALQFDGINGTMSPCILNRREKCDVCNDELGRGDPIW